MWGGGSTPPTARFPITSRAAPKLTTLTLASVPYRPDALMTSASNTPPAAPSTPPPRRSPSRASSPNDGVTGLEWRQHELPTTRSSFRNRPEPPLGGRVHDYFFFPRIGKTESTSSRRGGCCRLPPFVACTVDVGSTRRPFLWTMNRCYAGPPETTLRDHRIHPHVLGCSPGTRGGSIGGHIHSTQTLSSTSPSLSLNLR